MGDDDNGRRRKPVVIVSSVVPSVRFQMYILVSGM